MSAIPSSPDMVTLEIGDIVKVCVDHHGLKAGHTATVMMFIPIDHVVVRYKQGRKEWSTAFKLCDLRFISRAAPEGAPS